MLRYLTARAAQYGFVLLMAATLDFALPRAMPGSPLAHLGGEDVGSLTPADRARIVREAGLDRPLPEQYVTSLVRLAQGDLGYSYHRRRPVGALLAERLPWTVLLTGMSLLLAAGAGVLWGAWAAWRRGGAADAASLGLFLFLESLPAFWLAMLFVAVFAVQLRLVPTFGARDVTAQLVGAAAVLDVAHHLILPVATLTLVSVSGFFLTTRSSMLGVMGEEYLTVARAKGLSDRQVLRRHALRNALLPVSTVFLLNLGHAVAGATVVETVFSYPGVGRMMYEAVLSRDYPLLQGGFLAISVFVVAGNLAADLLYPLLDPRVRTRG